MKDLKRKLEAIEKVLEKYVRPQDELDSVYSQSELETFGTLVFSKHPSKTWFPLESVNQILNDFRRAFKGGNENE